MSARRLTRTPALLLVPATALLFGLAVGCGRGGAADKAGAETKAVPVAVQVATATLEKEPLTLMLDGTLVGDESARVTSVVPGRVVEVLVERGSRVAEGDPLIRLRDVDYRLQAKSARAQLEQARARIGMEDGAAPPKPEDLADVRAAKADKELAEANLARSEELGKRGVLSAQNLDQVRAQAAAARERYASSLNGARGALASMEGAKAALAQSATSAREATVRAPFSGEVADRMISVGEYVAPQTPLVALVRTDPLRLEVSVPQQNLRAVRAGQAVSVRVDAVPDRAFDGTIRYVSASVDQKTRSLIVEAIVPNPDGLLRPGLYATARIETGGIRDVASIPANAVQTRSNVTRVFVVKNGHIEERVVTITNRKGQDTVLIGEGLQPGEEVATSNLDRLADGVTVTKSADQRSAQLKK